MMLKRSDDLTQFQSTLSVRRATIPHVQTVAFELISIHALREESDEAQLRLIGRASDFNPRSP